MDDSGVDLAAGMLKSVAGGKLIGLFYLEGKRWDLTGTINTTHTPFEVSAARLEYTSSAQLKQDVAFEGRIETGTVVLVLGNGIRIVGDLKQPNQKATSISGQVSWSPHMQSDPIIPSSLPPSGNKTEPSMTTIHSNMVGTRPGTRTFDNSFHAGKIVSSIIVRSHGILEQLGVSYTDGSTVGPDPDRKSRPTDTFRLLSGEQVSGVLLWADHHIRAAQFMTSRNRASPLFGLHGGKTGNHGIPTLLWGNDKVLGAFRGTHDGSLRQIQVVWRGPVKLTGVPRLYPGPYNGIAKGDPFNEYDKFMAGLNSHVSSVSVYINREIVGIKFEYGWWEQGVYQRKQAEVRGTQRKASEQVFSMAKGEYITRVDGVLSRKSIEQICFTTNQGRSSGMYGSGRSKDSTQFSDSPPTNTNDSRIGLKFVIGKSSHNEVTGLLFVWGQIMHTAAPVAQADPSRIAKPKL